MAFSTYSHLCEVASDYSSLARAIEADEAQCSEKPVQEVRQQFALALEVMRESAEKSLSEKLVSRTGLTGGDGLLVANSDTTVLSDSTFSRVIACSLATAETNARMGKIVAAPTAGACGVLPGVLIPIAQSHCIDDDTIIDALLVAGAIGEIFASSSTLSGAAGGCQAEIGTASAMAAGALCYMLGGSAVAVGHAASLAMQGQLGLVCDPVGGLVEIPCVVRNATGASIALGAAQMALAGVEFPIPLDEVVKAASRIGKSIHPSLRETGRAGLANTPTGIRITPKPCTQN